MDFFLIGDETVKQLLDMLSVIEKVENVYTLKTQGKTTLFPVITHAWELDTKDMDIKSGEIGGDVNIYGLKALTYIEDNDKAGLPRLNGTMMVFNSANGLLKGVVDSRSITGMRTGAAGAIGSKYLARKDAESIALIGAGNQAFYNLAGNLLVMDAVKKAAVYDPLGLEYAERFAASFAERFRREILAKYIDRPDYSALEQKAEIEITAFSDPQAAVCSADIVVTVTPSRKPIVKKEWVRSGTHINCIGADMEGKEEIAAEIFVEAKIVVDDIRQATTIGETEIPFARGIVGMEAISEIGAIVNGDAPGRTSDREITIFDTTGLALQDLIVAEMLIEKAERSHIQKHTL